MVQRRQKNHGGEL